MRTQQKCHAQAHQTIQQTIAAQHIHQAIADDGASQTAHAPHDADGRIGGNQILTLKSAAHADQTQGVQTACTGAEQ